MHNPSQARYQFMLLLLLSLALGLRGWTIPGPVSCPQLRRARSSAPPPRSTAHHLVKFAAEMAHEEGPEPASPADLTMRPPRSSRGGVLGLIKSVLLFLPLLLRRALTGLWRSLFGRRNAERDEELLVVDEAPAVLEEEANADTPTLAVKQLTRSEIERVKRSFQAAKEGDDEKQVSQEQTPNDSPRVSTDLFQLWRFGQHRIEQLSARQVWDQVQEKVRSFERWQAKTFFSSSSKK